MKKGIIIITNIKGRKLQIVEDLDTGRWTGHIFVRAHFGQQWKWTHTVGSYKVPGTVLNKALEYILKEEGQ
jgi:hypothetical protein